MAVVQTISGLTDVTANWWPSASYGSLRMYDQYNYDYATLYKVQPNVRTCVDFLARNIAQLGLHVFERVSDTDRRRLRDHPLAVLIGKPNPWTTRYRLIEALMADLGIYFNAYWLKVRDGGRIALLRVPPQYVTPSGGLVPTGYEINLGSKVLKPTPDQIVHFRGYNPESSIQGLSPLETLRRVLAEEFSSGDYREYFWRNAARMNGIIERPKDAPEWSTTARERFKAEFEALYSGGINSGKTAILEEGMSWKQASFSAQESEYLAGRKLTREECARAYHIPLPMVGILDHATFCLPADTMISTGRGPIPISGVRPGDDVWGYDRETNSIGLFRVKASRLTGYKPLLTIRTQNRTIRCTDNHPILRRSRWQVNETVFPNRRRYEHCLDWLEAGRLFVGDIIVTLDQLPDVGIEACPTRQVSEGFAEFCGLLLGDGCIAKTRTGGDPTGVRVARAENAMYMDHYRQVMRREFTQRDGEVTLDEQERETRFASVSAARELVQLGLDGDAHSKRVPEWVFQLTPRLRAAFVRGFLDSDGSVDKKGRASFASCNEFMLRQVRELCIGLGVPVTNIRCQTGETTLPNGASAAFELWTFTCSDPGANREIIGSNDPRDQARLQQGKPFGRYYEYPERTGDVGIDAPPGCGYARVVSIERSELAVPVYDLEVEEAHSFVAEGVIVHNSNIKEQHKNLYQDALGPWLAMLEEEIALQLLPEFDSDGVYCEFNIAEKLQGSFEEQTQAMQSAVGRPWMTPDEARARFNLPSIGGDAGQLATPLNVLIGGQASPRDSAPKTAPTLKALKAAAEVDPTLATARERHIAKWAQVLAQFFKRQRNAIIGRVRDDAAIETVWIDGDRWDSELAADMFRLNSATAQVWGKWITDQLEAELDADRMANYLQVVSENAAGRINAATREQVASALLSEMPKDAVKNLFDVAITSRASEIAATGVNGAANFGAHEGAKQGGLRTKTWVVNSANPRDEHAAMAGETVDIGDLFSNGMRWPGDPAGGAENNANCCCSVAFGRD